MPIPSSAHWIPIGSYDFTLLALGVNRDSEFMSQLFDENDTAIKKEIIVKKINQMNTDFNHC